MAKAVVNRIGKLLTIKLLFLEDIIKKIINDEIIIDSKKYFGKVP